jgi:hypothetical protein
VQVDEGDNDGAVGGFREIRSNDKDHLGVGEGEGIGANIREGRMFEWDARFGGGTRAGIQGGEIARVGWARMTTGLFQGMGKGRALGGKKVL